jgi:uncharacterized protein YecE (DUF72 family)
VKGGKRSRRWSLVRWQAGGVSHSTDAARRNDDASWMGQAKRGRRVWVGISGYDYPRWKGHFYPADLPRSRWLGHAASRFDSIELNGTFYSLKTPSVFRKWVDAVPDDFVFAVKGSRFITHNLKLRRAEAALANFFASGVLALERKTGPFLWQLPATYRFEPERIDSFLRLLPRDASAAAELARGHDGRVRGEPLTEAAEACGYRHALEVRHASYFHAEFYEILRAHRCAFVVADTAGTFPFAEELTADFAYVRLHGSEALYASGYRDAELDDWAERIKGWMGHGIVETYVYFDNDALGHAPFDAERLAARLRER